MAEDIKNDKDEAEGTREILPQEAFAENMRIMNEIVAGMKEIPVLASEVPRDTNPLVKVEFPEKGGVLTWMENFDYPYKGFPYFEFVDKIDLGKKIIRAFASGLYHRLKKRNKLQLLLMLPNLWLSTDVAHSLLYVFYRLIERFRIKRERYCDAIRELYRAFSLEKFGETQEEREMRLMFRDSICMFLEFDNAYRYRAQDVIISLNKDNLKRAPALEILRLIKIMQSRENHQEIKDTWKLGQLLVRFYLRKDKKLLKILKDALLALDIDKIILQEDDKCYCKKRTDYNFSFMQENVCPQNTISPKATLLPQRLS